MPSLPGKMFIVAKTLEKQKLNFSRSALFRLKTKVSLKYFVSDCPRKQIFAPNLAQTP